MALVVGSFPNNTSSLKLQVLGQFQAYTCYYSLARNLRLMFSLICQEVARPLLTLSSAAIELRSLMLLKTQKSVTN
jgi:hypothetical protein